MRCRKDTSFPGVSHGTWVVRTLQETIPVRCPCGDAYRIITGEDNDKVSIHVVHIRSDSHRHYHKTMTEYYYCLEGEGHVELNDTAVAMRPGATVMIPPGVHHRAVGNLKILNIVAPPFCSDDEFLV